MVRDLGPLFGAGALGSRLCDEGGVVKVRGGWRGRAGAPRAAPGLAVLSAEAFARLLRAPAPQVAALAVKLDLLVAHQVWEFTFAETSLAAMRRDALRLAGEVTVTQVSR